MLPDRLLTVCAWCSAQLQAGTGEALEPVSHGICEKCAETLMQQMREQHPEVEDEDLILNEVNATLRLAGRRELGDETGG